MKESEGQYQPHKPLELEGFPDVTYNNWELAPLPNIPDDFFPIPDSRPLAEMQAQWRKDEADYQAKKAELRRVNPELSAAIDAVFNTNSKAAWKNLNRLIYRGRKSSKQAKAKK